jgi:hypothetical protein
MHDKGMLPKDDSEEKKGDTASPPPERITMQAWVQVLSYCLVVARCFPCAVLIMFVLECV